jgi:hypothetical protein
MKRIILLLILVILSIFTIGCSNTVEKGLLQGNVLIGPITPVEQPGQELTLRCDVYALRKIMIYDNSGEKLIQQVDIDCDEEEQITRYRVELEPDIYTVDISRIGVDYSDDVPKQVEIRSGLTVKLDIEIDTGIR